MKKLILLVTLLLSNSFAFEVIWEQVNPNEIYSGVAMGRSESHQVVGNFTSWGYNGGLIVQANTENLSSQLIFPGQGSGFLARVASAKRSAVTASLSTQYVPGSSLFEYRLRVFFGSQLRTEIALPFPNSIQPSCPELLINDIGSRVIVVCSHSMSAEVFVLNLSPSFSDVEILNSYHQEVSTFSLVNDTALSSDGSTLVIGAQNFNIVLEVDQNDLTESYRNMTGQGIAARDVDISKDGKLVVFANQWGQATAIHKIGTQYTGLPLPDLGMVTAIAISPSGEKIGYGLSYIGNTDMRLVSFNTFTQEILSDHTWPGEPLAPGNPTNVWVEIDFSKSSLILAGVSTGDINQTVPTVVAILEKKTTPLVELQTMGSVEDFDINERWMGVSYLNNHVNIGAYGGGIMMIDFR